MSTTRIPISMLSDVVPARAETGLFASDKLTVEARVKQMLDRYSLPPGWIAGCGISNNVADVNHDIDMAAGRVRPANGGPCVDVPAMTKRLDAAWAKGAGNGGCFNGAHGASTGYHAIVIQQDSSGDVDWGFDTSIAGSSKPSGWTVIRRVGWVKNDSSSNIISFTQSLNAWLWNSNVEEFTSTLVSGANNPKPVAVPAGLIVQVLLNMSQVGSGEVVSIGAGGQGLGGSQVSGLGGTAGSSTQIATLTNTSAQINLAEFGSGTSTVGFKTQGWIEFEPRGPWVP